MRLDEFIEDLQALEIVVGSHVPVYVVDSRTGVSDVLEGVTSRKNDGKTDGALLDFEEGRVYVEVVIG